MACGENHITDTVQPAPAPPPESVVSSLAVPIVAPLLRNRLVTLILLGFGSLQLGLVYVGLPGWICPIKATFGVPCPGCGTSTAIVALLRGDLSSAVSFHAFAPVILLGMVIMAGVTMLPGRLHGMITDTIYRVEQRTAVVFDLMVAMIVYWAIRIAGLG